MARYRDDDRDDYDDHPRRRDDDEGSRPSRRSSRDDDDEDRPRRRSRRYDDGPPPKQASVLGILALIGGIPSVAVTFIPCCGWVFGIIGGVITLLLGVIGLVTAKGSQGRIGTGMPLAGTILGGIALLLSIAWLIFFTVLAATAPTTPVGTVSTTDPIVASVTAADLTKEFKDNEVAANNKYKGKVVEVTGKVKRVTDTGGFSDITVELDGANFTSVECNFDDSLRSSVANLTVGSTVTIRGRCDGLSFNLSLDDCIVMPGGPTKTPTANTPIVVTADALAKEFRDDPKAANAKYNGKLVELTGTSAAVTTNPDGQTIINMNPNAAFGCSVVVADVPAAKKLKPGATVTVRGTCDDDGFGVVKFKDCTLVK